MHPGLNLPQIARGDRQPLRKFVLALARRLAKAGNVAPEDAIGGRG